MTLENKGITLAKDSRKLSVFFKGIAILLVILVHSHQCFDLTNAQNAIQRFGQMGCQIFFVLSSFGLCYSFSKKFPGWFSHMKKRISRLIIGYWGAIFITAAYRAVMAFVSKEDILSAINIPGIIINALFLNGFVPISQINNSIVRGGWYVGTTIILYALFPLLYKIYFINNKTWEKYRTLFFPVTVFAVTTTIVIVSSFIHPVFVCNNNSFMYFSFINQLTPFSLGLVLFDISKRYNNTKYAPGFSIALLVISLILFFGNYKYSFVFCPSFVAAAFALLYWYVLNNQKICDGINKNLNKVVRVINSFGKISFSIYLTHAFIVYNFSSVCLRILHRIYNNDLLWYILLLPVEFCLVYLLGYIYDKCISYIKKIKKTAE